MDDTDPKNLKEFYIIIEFLVGGCVCGGGGEGGGGLWEISLCFLANLVISSSRRGVVSVGRQHNLFSPNLV